MSAIPVQVLSAMYVQLHGPRQRPLILQFCILPLRSYQEDLLEMAAIGMQITSFAAQRFAY